MATDLAKLHICKLDKEGDLHWESKPGRHDVSKHDGDGVIDMSALSRSECVALEKLMRESRLPGSKIVAADIRKYLAAATKGVDKLRARTCRQAAWMLEKFITDLPHHLFFRRDDYGGNSYAAYYVADVEYEPEKPGNSRREREPEYVEIELWYIDAENRHRSSIILYRGDCLERTCLEILADKGYVPESPRLVENLRRETELFYAMTKRVGQQMIARGKGICDIDSATKSSDQRAYGRDEIVLDRFGLTNVVIDVLEETDKDDEMRSRRSTRESPDPFRWHEWNMRFFTPAEDDLVRHMEADDDTAEPIDFEIPVHPLVPCFDLRRHLRMRIHVSNLKPYQYDRSIGAKLVIPERDWKMVELLVDHSSNEFKDVISNKGRSMNVLSTGKPGVGKTLTAEIFAEYKERPLYTVQCSQLGMKPSEVEKNLSIIMARANRWNAVLLLDEADVYIRRRGKDLKQNAIVGAFLRILEYASCILFMTTNLAESVDDAVASRCIARLNYATPSPADQTRIWKILAGVNNIALADIDIAKIVKAHPTLTGRDVKNLLKLASLKCGAGQPINPADIEYASQFKPTN